MLQEKSEKELLGPYIVFYDLDEVTESELKQIMRIVVDYISFKHLLIASLMLSASISPCPSAAHR